MTDTDIREQGKQSRADRIRRYAERGCELFANSGETRHNARAVERKFGHAQGESQLRFPARPGIARDGDVVEPGELDAGFVEAELNCLHGKPGGVFDAIQALLFDGGEQAAVGHNRGGGVGVIGIDAQDDHVFAFLR